MMTITCRIDRVAALQAGIETTSKIIQVPVDLAVLPPADRELLAGRLNSNMEVCGKYTDGNDVGKFWNGGSATDYPSTADINRQVMLLMVTAPTIEAILSAIRAEDACAVQYAATQAAEKAKQTEDRRQKTLDVLSQRRTVSEHTNAVARRNMDGQIEVDVDYSTIRWTVYVPLERRKPNWPSYVDEAVTQSAEATAWLAQLDAENEAAVAEAQKEVRQRLLNKEAADARKAAEEERNNAQRVAWIAEHGSLRLQRLVAEDIEHQNVYLEERLALERPGWAYQSDVDGEADEARNCRQEGLDLLDEARKTDPTAKLVWWVVDNSDDPDRDDTVVLWKGYACTAEFFGLNIVFGVPSEYAC